MKHQKVSEIKVCPAGFDLFNKGEFCKSKKYGGKSCCYYDKKTDTCIISNKELTSKSSKIDRGNTNGKR